MSIRSRLSVVAFAERPPPTRIISPRCASCHERTRYEQQETASTVFFLASQNEARRPGDMQAAHYWQKPAPFVPIGDQRRKYENLGGPRIDKKGSFRRPTFASSPSPTNNKIYAMYVYERANHAFNNDTNAARYNKEAADLAWSRTIQFLKKYLSSA
jgi:hypothetical protein